MAATRRAHGEQWAKDAFDGVRDQLLGRPQDRSSRGETAANMGRGKPERRGGTQRQPGLHAQETAVLSDKSRARGGLVL
jgi:hypothetical protein